MTNKKFTFVKVVPGNGILHVYNKEWSQDELHAQLSDWGFSEKDIDTLFTGVENSTGVFPYLSGKYVEGESRFNAAVYPGYIWDKKMWFNGEVMDAPQIHVTEESVPAGLCYMDCYFVVRRVE